MTLTIKTFSGHEAAPFFDDVARLRIEVFRAFPYLYEGSKDYERRYLSTYARSPGTIFVLAFDGSEVVGAATGTPMAGETREVKAPFVVSGYNTDSIFYFGESILKSGYRGRGIGVRFIEERERYAIGLGGMRHCTFCAIERPDDHVRRPADYVPLDDFWRKRGYLPRPDLRTTFSWQDIDETVESPKPMSFWIKEL
jgi:GNAT superfamily N-acetyltransferase